jgi:polar amino acid transport system substrate-binding protein
MGPKLFSVLAVFALTTGFLGFGWSETPADSLTLLTEDWPPYNFEENGVVRGLTTEVVQAIEKDLGLEDPIQLLPGNRIVPTLGKSSRTLFFTMLRTPERESLYQWIGPIGEQALSFYKKKGSPLDIRSLDDAKKVGSVSCRNAGTVFQFLTAAGFTNLDTTTNAEGIYQKVVLGRCDLAIGEAPEGVAYWLRKANLPADALVQTPVSILRIPLYLCCTKDIPAAEVSRWQQALDRLKASGEAARIFQRYRS